MRNKNVIRGILELVGVMVFVGLHGGILWWIYLVGGSRVAAPGLYWSAIALGYVGMVFVAVFRLRVFGAAPSRRLLDAWLLAFPVAVGVALVLLLAKLPLSSRGWDAHGMGATGGEVNSLFLPWLHLAVWILTAKRWTTGSRAGQQS